MKWICLAFVMFAGLQVKAATPELWLYYPVNLLNDEAIQKMQPIWERASKAGYTHIVLQDSKFGHLATLGENEKHYLANVAKTRNLAAKLKLELMPEVFPIGYSNDLLANDPNLAEGLPVKNALFVVHEGKANIVADPPVSLGKNSFVDPSVGISDGIATINSNQGNARMVWQLTVTPFRCYHISVKFKADNFSGRPEIKALAGEMSLQYENVKFNHTQDWTQCDVVFNTLDHQKVAIYIGVWGDAKGTLQMRDWKIEEAGLTNVLRRPGAPVTVSLDKGGRVLKEGADYLPIKDPRMGNEPWPGEYVAWHESPAIATKLPEGTRLRVSWCHPAIIYDEQVAACFEEPKTKELLADQAKRMTNLFGDASGFLMAHDELRVLGWDPSCMAKHQTPGQLLADNARYCEGLLGGHRVAAWSDMFDPFHNAVDKYYLVNGSLEKSWEGLSKDVLIFNWNHGKRDQSLKWFSDRGHKQVIAGYYDSGNVADVNSWLESADKVRGMVGIMYTTWEGNYAEIESFAKLVKGHFVAREN